VKGPALRRQDPKSDEGVREFMVLVQFHPNHPHVVAIIDTVVEGAVCLFVGGYHGRAVLSARHRYQGYERRERRFGGVGMGPIRDDDRGID
jgi:hypothetical protein